MTLSDHSNEFRIKRRALNDPDEQLREWAMIYDRSKTNEQLKKLEESD